MLGTFKVEVVMKSLARREANCCSYAPEIFQLATLFDDMQVCNMHHICIFLSLLLCIYLGAPVFYTQMTSGGTRWLTGCASDVGAEKKALHH